MTRVVERRYRDPLETIWLECARRVGLSIERSPDAYASSDGSGTLLLSDPSGLDADDSLAQMILHELCHALVQGPQSFDWIDWGLDNEGNRDDDLERACLRLQAALLEPLGLRRVLAPTTDFRAFYDALGSDPFAEKHPDERESIVRARLAYARRDKAPIGPHLREALVATVRIAEAGRGYASNDSLWSLAEPASPPHRLGLSLHARADASCDDCAYAQPSNQPNTSASKRCGALGRKELHPGERACELFEAALDCQSCGACCREAYDLVVVRPREQAAKRHPELLVASGGAFDLPRPDGRCRALHGGVPLVSIRPAIDKVPPGGLTQPGQLPRAAAETASDVMERPRYLPGNEPFSCAIYEDRPKSCRDFERGSQNCRQARQAVGLGR